MEKSLLYNYGLKFLLSKKPVQVLIKLLEEVSSIWNNISNWSKNDWFFFVQAILKKYHLVNCKLVNEYFYENFSEKYLFSHFFF